MKPVKEWRDRSIICKGAEKEQMKVKFQCGDTTFALAWRDSTWMVGNDSTELCRGWSC